MQTDLRVSSARRVAATIPSLDFLGWHSEPCVVVRTNGSADGDIASVELKELPTRRKLDGVDLRGEDAAWLTRKDVPMDYDLPSME